MSDNKRRPMGITVSFSKVTFKKDGQEVYTANVTSGGCFGPNPDLDVINGGYASLKKEVADGKLPSTAIDFNAVAVRGREYAVINKGPDRIKAADLKKIS